MCIDYSVFEPGLFANTANLPAGIDPLLNELNTVSQPFPNKQVMTPVRLNML
jgi:hypothetical protein